MQVLIIKTGALGDVVRTQFFAKYLNEKKGYQITWLTSDESCDILANNPYINSVTVNEKSLYDKKWDKIYNLEDGIKYAELCTKLTSNEKFGLMVTNGNKITYDSITSEWNDMGLHSKLGITEANFRKKINQKSHLEIFEGIFRLNGVIPNWKGNFYPKKIVDIDNLTIGVNLFAGERWPNKSLDFNESQKLIYSLEQYKNISRINILGKDKKNLELINSADRRKVFHIDTSADISHLVSAIRSCDFLITCDSLAVHIAIATSIPYICFFGPTSSKEIKPIDLPYVNIEAICSNYCSYDPTAQVEGITSTRIINALETLIRNL